MSPHLPRIIVHIHNELSRLPGVESVAREFETYKSYALQIATDSECDVSNFLPTLDEEDQKAFRPDHQFFGRDRLFYGERIRAANDPVFHVHLHHEETIKSWYDFDKADVFVSQWHCVSDAALVYAYLKTESDDYHFLLLEIVAPGAHDLYQTEGKIAEWRHKTRNFRYSSQNPSLRT